MYQHQGPQYQHSQQGYNQGQYPPPQQAAQGYAQQPPYQQYPQQPYQQSYNQGYQQGPPPQGGPPHQGHGPPPKKKGNPVITRYAPPPGYRPPAPQGGQTYYQGPQGYAQQSYPPQSGYGPPQNGYPPQAGYQQPPSYPPQQGSSPPNWQQQHQGYPPQQGYQYPNQQSYDQSGYQQPHYPPHQGYQGHQGQPPYPDPNQQWQQQPSYPGPTPPQEPSYPPPQNGYHAQQPPYAGPNQPQHQPPGPTPPQSATASAGHRPSQSDAGTGARAMSVSEEVGWDFEYYGEPWAKDLETIDPDLSIGIIVWHPASPTSRALPSTFTEAEQDMADAVKKPESKKRKLEEEEQESVSKYFVGEKAEEALLNVRQTREWKNVKDDLIFVEFPATYDLIPLREVKASRDRPDIDDEEVGSEMDIEEGDELELPKKEPIEHERESSHHVTDNLFQALSSSDYSTGNKPGSDATVLTNSATAPPDQNQMQPLQPVRDTAQEDILAQLGVSGSPKPVYPTPGPAYMPPRQDSPLSQVQAGQVHAPPHQDLFPPPDQRSPPAEIPERAAPTNGQRPPGFRNRRSSHSGNQQEHQPLQPQLQPQIPQPPPPPEPERSPEYDPWRATDHANSRHGLSLDGAHDSPGAQSNNSQHTLVGSDFQQDGDEGADAFDPNSEGKSKRKQGRNGSGISRKRSYNDEDDQDDERRRQPDDVTPKYKRKQPKVDAAYGRRW